MSAYNLDEVGSTTTVTANPAVVYGVSLSAGSDAASLELRDNGSTGTKKLTLKAAAGATVTHTLKGSLFSSDVHATLSGTSPVASVEYG